MNREEYLKKLKDAVENGKPDDDLTTHHYAVLDKANQKAKKVRIETPPLNEELMDKLRREGRPSANDKLKVTDNGIEHVTEINLDNELDTEEERRLRRYSENINEVLGENIIKMKNGDLYVEGQQSVTPDQITRERVIREIALLEEENQRCYLTISKNNDLLTYLKIEFSTL